MKFTLIIDNTAEEEIIIKGKSYKPVFDRIKELIEEENNQQLIEKTNTCVVKSANSGLRAF